MANKVLTRVFPFAQGDGENVTEADWRDMVQKFLRPGVAKGEGTEFDAEPGTGLSVVIHPGHGWVVGHYLKSTQDETLTLETADANNPRIDRVVMFVDMINREGGLKVLTGDPDANPVPKTPTQNENSMWEEPLWDIYVAAGATSLTSSNLTRVAKTAMPPLHKDNHKTGGDDALAPADIGAATQTALDAHTGNHNNPHAVTAAQIGAQAILDQLKTVDGAGSGLDADKLQGHDPDDFATPAMITDAFTANTAADASTRDWDTLTAPGVSPYLVRSDAPNAPPTSAARYFYVLTLTYGDRIVQIAYPYIATTADDTMWVRTCYAGTWSAWRKVWDSGAIQHITGDGECIRYPDGAQICWVADFAVPAGSSATWTYPAAFIATPGISANSYRVTVYYDDYPSTTSVKLKHNSADDAIKAYVVAVGRWK